MQHAARAKARWRAERVAVAAGHMDAAENLLAAWTGSLHIYYGAYSTWWAKARVVPALTALGG